MTYEELAADLGIDPEEIDELIADEGETVLTLGWDSDRPGGSGSNHIVRWKNYYFFTSTDMDSEGPFESLDEALALEYFHTEGTPSPEIYSETLDFEQLEAIARDIDQERASVVNINDKFYEWENDTLKEK